MVVSPNAHDVTESSSFDQRYGCSKGISEHYYGSKGIWSQILRRMHPSSCLGACSGEVDFSHSRSMQSSVAGSSLRSIVPDIMRVIDYGDDEENGSSMYHRRKRNLALKSLYELSSEKQNR